jgi:hypothetical protein
MIDELLPYAQLTATGALVLVLVYIIRTISSGSWYPEVVVNALLAAKDAEIARAHEEIERSNTRGNEWHTAYEGERHVSELVRDQNRELIEVAKTSAHALEALESVVERSSRVVPPPD